MDDKQAFVPQTLHIYVIVYSILEKTRELCVKLRLTGVCCLSGPTIAPSLDERSCYLHPSSNIDLSAIYGGKTTIGLSNSRDRIWGNLTCDLYALFKVADLKSFQTIIRPGTLVYTVYLCSINRILLRFDNSQCGFYKSWFFMICYHHRIFHSYLPCIINSIWYGLLWVILENWIADSYK